MSIKHNSLNEATIDHLRNGIQRGAYTARSLAEQYLARIEALDKSEPTLIKLAYSFEQATKVRQEPSFLSSVDLRTD